MDVTPAALNAIRDLVNRSPQAQQIVNGAELAVAFVQRITHFNYEMHLPTDGAKRMLRDLLPGTIEGLVGTAFRNHLQASTGQTAGPCAWRTPEGFHFFVDGPVPGEPGAARPFTQLEVVLRAMVVPHGVQFRFDRAGSNEVRLFTGAAEEGDFLLFELYRCETEEPGGEGTSSILVTKVPEPKPDP